MSIKVKAVLSNLEVGGQPIYRAIPKDVVKINETEFLRRVAVKAGQDAVQARYWLDTFRDVLYSSLANNEAVDLNFMYAKLYVGGSLNAITDQPTKEANPVKPRIYAKGELASAIGAIEVINDTETVPAVLNEVMQDDASDKNRIEAAGKRIVINGSYLKQDPNRTDNGVWLENCDTGIMVKEATVSYSDPSTIYCSFASLPATGKYRLVIATRNAEDPDVYALAKLPRYVYVVNG